MSAALPLPPGSESRRTRRPASWRLALPLLFATFLAILAIYHATAAAMVEIWIRSDTFAHAFVVPPIVGWLVWRQRHELAGIEPRPAPWVLVPILAIGLLWLSGELAAVNAAAQLAFVAMLVLAVPAVLGWRVAHAVAFPLAFLFFTVPIGEFLLPELMQLTADFTVAAVRLSGVPVYREGLMFVIPTGNWSVVEACSGVRYLIASFMVGTLYAYLMYRSIARRLTFMIVALLMPLLANWVRAYLIVMLGHLSNNQIATGVDHLIYGWLFFGIVITALFMVGARWAESQAPASERLPAAPVVPSQAGGWQLAVMSISFVAVITLPPLVHREIERRETTVTPTLPTLLDLAPQWASTPGLLTDWRPAFESPSASATAVYRVPGKSPVGVALAYYRNQGYDHKLGDTSSLLAHDEDKLWSRVSGHSRRVEGDAGTTEWQVAELRKRSVTDSEAGSRLTVWQLYWVGGRFTDSDGVAKVLVAINRLLGRGDDAAVVILYTDANSAGDADAALAKFVQVNLGYVDALLLRARSVR